MDIINTHNGEFKVMSEEGKSTTFIITLPSYDEKNN
jgi:signal transduction histidine kinase